MMNVIYILTAMLAVIILTVMLFNYVFYYRYVDRSEHHCLAAIVFTVSMSLHFAHSDRCVHRERQSERNYQCEH